MSSTPNSSDLPLSEDPTNCLNTYSLASSECPTLTDGTLQSRHTLQSYFTDASDTAYSAISPNILLLPTQRRMISSPVHPTADLTTHPLLPDPTLSPTPTSTQLSSLTTSTLCDIIYPITSNLSQLTPTIQQQNASSPTPTPAFTITTTSSNIPDSNPDLQYSKPRDTALPTPSKRSADQQPRRSPRLALAVNDSPSAPTGTGSPTASPESFYQQSISWEREHPRSDATTLPMSQHPRRQTQSLPTITSVAHVSPQHYPATDGSISLAPGHPQYDPSTAFLPNDAITDEDTIAAPYTITVQPLYPACRAFRERTHPTHTRIISLCRVINSGTVIICTRQVHKDQLAVLTPIELLYRLAKRPPTPTNPTISRDHILPSSQPYSQAGAPISIPSPSQHDPLPPRTSLSDLNHGPTITTASIPASDSSLPPTAGPAQPILFPPSQWAHTRIAHLIALIPDAPFFGPTRAAIQLIVPDLLIPDAPHRTGLHLPDMPTVYGPKDIFHHAIATELFSLRHSSNDLGPTPPMIRLYGILYTLRILYDSYLGSLLLPPLPPTAFIPAVRQLLIHLHQLQRVHSPTNPQSTRQHYATTLIAIHQSVILTVERTFMGPSPYTNRVLPSPDRIDISLLQAYQLASDLLFCCYRYFTATRLPPTLTKTLRSFLATGGRHSYYCTSTTPLQSTPQVLMALSRPLQEILIALNWTHLPHAISASITRLGDDLLELRLASPFGPPLQLGQPTTLITHGSLLVPVLYTTLHQFLTLMERSTLLPSPSFYIDLCQLFDALANHLPSDFVSPPVEVYDYPSASIHRFSILITDYLLHLTTRDPLPFPTGLLPIFLTVISTGPVQPTHPSLSAIRVSSLRRANIPPWTSIPTPAAGTHHSFQHPPPPTIAIPYSQSTSSDIPILHMAINDD